MDRDADDYGHNPYDGGRQFDCAFKQNQTADVITKRAMKCEECGCDTYVVHINEKHQKVCGDCHEREFNMHLHLMRFSTGKESTLGTLSVNGTFECYMLEDTKRIKKIDGETRIPDGLYRLALRKEGGLHKKYAQKYPGIHQGMLWIKDVPGFEWVYIHVGNKRGHTEGCQLPGDSINNNQIGDGFVGRSGDAYKRLYPRVAKVLQSGFSVTLRISNFG